MSEVVRVLVVGNPNCGKTVVFNALTGLQQKVGNWAGVTVEKKQGLLKYQDTKIAITDLPGIYSMTLASEQEALDAKVACGHLLDSDYDIIINVVDAANLERNLYLSSQLVSLKTPMILALNMMDVAKRKGIKINTKLLSAAWNCPVVPMVACKGHGIDDLKEEIINVAASKQEPKFSVDYIDSVKAAVNHLQQYLIGLVKPKQAELVAYSLCEGNCCAKAMLGAVSSEVKKVLHNYPNLDLAIADARYQAVADLIDKVVSRKSNSLHNSEAWLDKIVLNKYLGVPIFFFVMYLMFYVAISIGGVFQDFFDILSQGIFVNGLSQLLISLQAPAWLQAFLADGIGKGINTTITFAPVIAGMFLCLSFLEDSGYMARAACVMDRLMRRIGLSGASFVPMIVGFGCNVPAVMGARTLKNQRDRILSIMMMPFMTCGARLAIFSVFAAAFFPHTGSYVIFSLYLMGIIIAILTAKILGSKLLKAENTPLVMEMPAYHSPKISVLLQHTWRRLKKFVWRAGKNIVIVCLIISGLNSISTDGKIIDNSANVSHSVLSAVGRAVTPIFHPMGIEQNNWPATVGLATGILAKEVVIGSLNSLYSSSHQQVDDSFSLRATWHDAVGSIGNNASGLLVALENPVAASAPDDHLDNSAVVAMHKAFGSPMAAFAYLVFILLYFPCVSTMAVIRRELGLGWTTFSVLWTTGVAYGMAVLIYQLSLLWG